MSGAISTAAVHVTDYFRSQSITPQPRTTRLDPVPAYDAALYQSGLQLERSSLPFTSPSVTPEDRAKTALACSPHRLIPIAVTLRLRHYFDKEALEDLADEQDETIENKDANKDEDPLWTIPCAASWNSLNHLHPWWRTAFFDYQPFPAAHHPGHAPDQAAVLLDGVRFYIDEVMGGKENLTRPGSIFGNPGAPNSLAVVMQYAWDLQELQDAATYLLLGIAMKAYFAINARSIQYQPDDEYKESMPDFLHLVYPRHDFACLHTFQCCDWKTVDMYEFAHRNTLSDFIRMMLMTVAMEYTWFLPRNKSGGQKKDVVAVAVADIDHGDGEEEDEDEDNGDELDGEEDDEAEAEGKEEKKTTRAKSSKRQRRTTGKRRGGSRGGMRQRVGGGIDMTTRAATVTAGVDGWINYNMEKQNQLLLDTCHYRQQSIPTLADDFNRVLAQLSDVGRTKLEMRIAYAAWFRKRTETITVMNIIQPSLHDSRYSDFANVSAVHHLLGRPSLPVIPVMDLRWQEENKIENYKKLVSICSMFCSQGLLNEQKTRFSRFVQPHARPGAVENDETESKQQQQQQPRRGKRGSTLPLTDGLSYVVRVSPVRRRYTAFVVPSSHELYRTPPAALLYDGAMRMKRSVLDFNESSAAHWSPEYVMWAMKKGTNWLDNNRGGCTDLAYVRYPFRSVEAKEGPLLPSDAIWFSTPGGCSALLLKSLNQAPPPTHEAIQIRLATDLTKERSFSRRAMIIYGALCCLLVNEVDIICTLMRALCIIPGDSESNIMTALAQLSQGLKEADDALVRSLAPGRTKESKDEFKNSMVGSASAMANRWEGLEPFVLPDIQGYGLVSYSLARHQAAKQVDQLRHRAMTSNGEIYKPIAEHSLKDALRSVVTRLYTGELASVVTLPDGVDVDDIGYFDTQTGVFANWMNWLGSVERSVIMYYWLPVLEWLMSRCVSPAILLQADDKVSPPITWNMAGRRETQFAVAKARIMAAITTQVKHIHKGNKFVEEAKSGALVIRDDSDVAVLTLLSTVCSAREELRYISTSSNELLQARGFTDSQFMNRSAYWSNVRDLLIERVMVPPYAFPRELLVECYHILSGDPTSSSSSLRVVAPSSAGFSSGTTNSLVDAIASILADRRPGVYGRGIAAVKQLIAVDEKAPPLPSPIDVIVARIRECKIHMINPPSAAPVAVIPYSSIAARGQVLRRPYLNAPTPAYRPSHLLQAPRSSSSSSSSSSSTPRRIPVSPRGPPLSSSSLSSRAQPLQSPFPIVYPAGMGASGLPSTPAALVRLPSSAVAPSQPPPSLGVPMKRTVSHPSALMEQLLAEDDSPLPPPPPHSPLPQPPLLPPPPASVLEWTQDDATQQLSPLAQHLQSDGVDSDGWETIDYSGFVPHARLDAPAPDG